MRRPPPNPAGWLWVLGAATVVMAVRWREIGLYGGEIPFLDSWLVEARQILLPWLEGNLTVADFFRSHHEHIPAWTRLMVWLEAVVFRHWDNQFQATLNAVLMGGFTGLFAAWLRRALPLVPALVITVLAVVLASLPHSWENIVWGFQSHIPLALLFVFAYQQGTFTQPTGTTSWWLAQAAGLAVLFTLGSMWAAPLSVLLVLLWTKALDWKRLLTAGLLTLGGVVLLFAARAQMPTTGAATLGAKDLPQFLAALLYQLGWPSAWPGVALLVNLPVLFLALRLRGRTDAAPLDRTLLALAGWAAAQAAAFAYARGSYVGFVSRYGDLLALGLLANGVALWRLNQGSWRWSRLCFACLALAWCGTVASGLCTINREGHTLYFHEHSSQQALVRRVAVTQYIANKDRNVLDSAEARTVLFPNSDEVASVLDHAALVAMLPFEVRTGGAKNVGDLFNEVSASLRENWLEIACCGGLLLFIALVLTGRNGDVRNLEEPLPPSTVGKSAGILMLLAICCGSLLFLWSQPFEFRVERRWAQFLTPAGTVPNLNFLIVTETSYPKDQLQGGASLWPENFRNTFFGTHIDGPAFTGVVESSPFPLNAPWYIVPYAGFPASEGNALRFRVEDAAGHTLEEIPCSGPNPGTGPTDIGFWEVDVRRFVGRTGRLILQDQRTDNEGWVAVAPPHATTDGPALAATHRHRWAAESTLTALRSLQVICLTLTLLAAGSSLSWWSNRHRRATEARK